MPDWTAATTSTYTTGTIGTNNIYTTISSYIDQEEKFKEFAEKVDKHVDQLEEDIAFLNDERELLKTEIARLELDLSLANDRIKVLEDMKGFINYLADKIKKLEDNNEHIQLP